jgi:hypothetical protein
LATPRALAEAIATIDSMRPGEFSWHPDRAPAGAVAIVVSLPDQRVYVYRNGVRIAVSTCSTGKPGHETPTGVFTILQKDQHHRSSTYNNAPMPNMNRLTWSGVALHAGDLPGYPASHGCVRLPLEFSERLFTVTRIGTPVIIANAATFPSTVLHPGMVLSADAAKEFDAVVVASKSGAPPTNLGDEYEPPVTSILVSSTGGQMLVLDDGRVVAKGTATIKQPEEPLGNHVFILTEVDPATKRLSWQTIGYYNDPTRSLEQSELATLDRIRGDHDVIAAVRSRMRPGTVLTTVDVPLSADTRTGEDFVIMSYGDEG